MSTKDDNKELFEAINKTLSPFSGREITDSNLEEIKDEMTKALHSIIPEPSRKYYSAEIDPEDKNRVILSVTTRAIEGNLTFKL